MQIVRKLSFVLLLGSTLATPESAIRTAATPPPIIWQNPANLQKRSLYYGAASPQHQPRPPFRFIKEDLKGGSPKFVVRDAAGVKWKVKFGAEARPEVAASRIVWSAGYFTDEDYLVPNFRAQDMPARLHRGRKFVEPDGSILYARLKPDTSAEKAIGRWQWSQNPFAGTRPLYGLRVLMALLNDWDLKDENNAIRQEDGKTVYLVSDLGATFGTPGMIWPLEKAKGNLDKYARSKFVRGTTMESVDFSTPARPRFTILVNPPEYLRRIHLEWIGRDIPRADARWLGQLLARLSPGQIEDAFRAAGYSDAEGHAFTRVLRERIATLADL